MTKFKFSVGPWNVHTGADSYGPETRKEIPVEEKFKKFFHSPHAVGEPVGQKGQFIQYGHNFNQKADGGNHDARHSQTPGAVPPKAQDGGNEPQGQQQNAGEKVAQHRGDEAQHSGDVHPGEDFGGQGRQRGGGPGQKGWRSRRAGRRRTAPAGPPSRTNISGPGAPATPSSTM